MQIPKKLFKIGEVIRYSGIGRQTLHNYTVIGLIREAERTESGHRLYDESVFERLKRIDRLRAHRTLRDVKELLDAEDATNQPSPTVVTGTVAVASS
ncbi:MAG: MerR family DNA-binding transcriptional regulator [Planctomycetota bacterium]|nr:MerR family DNA-binding transcriptional regulator [Planctomycetota bacterium]